MSRKPSVILADENLYREGLKTDISAITAELKDLEKARSEEMRTHVANMAKYEQEEKTLRRKLARLEEKI
jgi:hypothetical protein